LPDVNTSGTDFTPTDDSITFGLSAIRHVGEGVVEKIIEARSRKGEFESFHDFCRKVDYQCLNKKAVEALIKSGAFESLGHTRKGLQDRFEDICAQVIERRRQEEAGQFSLFAARLGDDAPAEQEIPISLEEHPKEILLAQEKDVLGLFVSDHPLLGVEGLLARMTDCSIAALSEKASGDVVTIGGVTAAISKRVTRKGDIMTTLIVEDLSGASIEVILFPRAYEQFAHLVRPDGILLIKGRVDQDVRDDSIKLIALEMIEPRLDARPFEIRMTPETCTPNLVAELKGILAGHPGSTQVFLHLATAQRTTVLRLGSEFCVDTTNGLHAELKAHLGTAISIAL
jgi:DNA polymerase-3 subunit alpha